MSPTGGPGLDPDGPLLAGLLVDTGSSTGSTAAITDALTAHARHRGAWYAGALGPLLVRDDRLAEVGRHWSRTAAAPLPVMVVNTSGAGGLLALAQRCVPGIRLVAVESALRDLDDLSGNVARVAAAAGALDESVDVLVGLPYARGWAEAAAEVEAAGLSASVAGGDPDRLAAQLRVLIETDLPFAISAAASSPDGSPEPTRRPAGPGLLSLLAAVEALIEDAEPAEAADPLRHTDPESDQQSADRVRGWNAQTQLRVRRRLLRLACAPVTGPIDELVRTGLLSPA